MAFDADESKNVQAKTQIELITINKRYGFDLYVRLNDHVQHICDATIHF